MTVDTSVPGALLQAVVSKGSQRGDTFMQLAANSPPNFPRRFGDALIRGRASATFLSVRFDEYTPARPSGDRWLFSNSVSATTSGARVGRLRASDWIEQLVRVLGEHPSVLWGAAFEHGEFQLRNLHTEGGGMWAVGRDVRRSLPGLYWLNVFGPAYVKLIGSNTLRSAPAYAVTSLGDAVAVQLYEQPAGWSAPAGALEHASVLEHLGTQFFYDRTAPDRATVAPDFGLTALPERPPLQVMTVDGEHFTPLPTDGG